MASKEKDTFHKIIIRTFVLAVFLFAILVLAPYFIVNQYHRYTVTVDNYDTALENPPETSIVLGSGVLADGSPSFVLKSRLDSSLELYREGHINEIIVSGYANIAEEYNEPEAMKSYLMSQGVPEKAVIEDSGGHDTLASCQSSYQNIGVRRATVITQPGHLDRAVFLCRSIGIEAYGVESIVTGTQGDIYFQSLREAGSNIKAVFEIVLVKMNLI